MYSSKGAKEVLCPLLKTLDLDNELALSQQLYSAVSCCLACTSIFLICTLLMWKDSLGNFHGFKPDKVFAGTLSQCRTLNI